MSDHDTATARHSAGEIDTPSSSGTAAIGLVLGAFGVLAAVWTFWLVVPGIVLGVAAIALGIHSRRRAPNEVSSVAIALGIVALMLVPSVLVVVDGAEDWGRECALNPSNPDC